MDNDYDNGVIVDRSIKSIEDFQHLLSCIYLYINWKYVTKQLTTEQKELFAKSIESATRRDGEECAIDRWWLK